ncbi:hypothetical protein TNIN_415401 [Trichonephila inaurata madagascariensis]|uniref:Uncharacterized protein n=1 Tax=Trichonephila inaurata madagascariensis TaxID=2747483 RepID=A0A8X6Y620_9ARAC|nr:hypothetical protein TNIN_415401 [Trichonephila inaurata madagascariensis]
MTSWRWIHFEMGEEFSNMKMISLTHPAPLLPPEIREGGRQQTISVLPQSFFRIGWDPSRTLSTARITWPACISTQKRPTDENTGNK